ncbi:hypothetical protein BGZ93_007136 [Podila epicladia]|nr:hypothetical protein BGZ92_001462 [Podila epicladia]KAG0094498.1 hypothetical protein BGZ93_007136 [Podila epicladia]
MIKSILALVFTTVVLLFFSTAAHAVPAHSPPMPSGKTIVLNSVEEYCLFLPRRPGQTIGESEDSAVAFCNKPISTAPNARTLPTAFIRNLNFYKNADKGYVQITGLFNRRSVSLSRHDGGGQYDIKAPRGAKCYGYPYFVELVEPDVERYCLRCCKNKKDCPVHKSTQGCVKVLGGIYV